MNIVMRDGRVFRGTAVQIVKAMQDIAFGVEQFTLPEYIELCEKLTKIFNGEDDESKNGSASKS